MAAYERRPAGRPLVVRVPNEDVRALADVAAHEDRSLAAEVRRLVRRRLREAELDGVIEREVDP